MTFEEVMGELAALGKESLKRVLVKHGVREPFFGVAICDLKPMAKRIKRDHELAERLYATGNYDAMYFAGFIADPGAMTEADFERWMDAAYFNALSNYVVAALLAETVFAQSVADKWIDCGEELRMSAGWCCYDNMLSTMPDSAFDRDKLKAMLDRVAESIHSQPDWVRYSMNNFIIALGISYLPLHEEAVKAAEAVGKVSVDMGKTSCKVPLASAYIEKAAARGKLGHKRKNTRC